MGLQVVGRPGDDVGVLQVAHALEQVFRAHERPPDLAALRRLSGPAVQEPRAGAQGSWGVRPPPTLPSRVRVGGGLAAPGHYSGTTSVNDGSPGYKGDAAHVTRSCSVACGASRRRGRLSPTGWSMLS